MVNWYSPNDAASSTISEDDAFQLAVWFEGKNTRAVSTARIYDLGVTYLDWPKVMPSDVDRKGMLVQLRAISSGGKPSIYL